MNKKILFVSLYVILLFVKSNGLPIPNLSYDEANQVLRLYGDDLGTNAGIIKVENDNSIQFSLNEITNSFTSPYPSLNRKKEFNITWTDIGETYTLYSDPIPPQVAWVYGTMSSLLTEIGFTGRYFTYNVSDVKVVYGIYPCAVNRATYYEINCTFGYLPPQKKKLDIYIQVGNNKYINEFNSFNIAVCPKNCSNNGICPDGSTTCICNNNFAGVDCSQTFSTISSISTLTEDGGLLTIFGDFGTLHNNLTVLIGNAECTLPTINKTVITCNAPAGKGTQTITVSQNGIKTSKANMFRYISTTFECINNCNNKGICDKSTGRCTSCNAGWKGIDCGSLATGPPTEKIIDDKGTASFSNQQTNYQVLIKKLVEKDVDGKIILSIDLQDNWNINKSESTYKFTQSIGTNSTLVYTIQEINEDKDFEFAGVLFTVEAGSIKLTIEIFNYQYKSVLNSIQLQMESSSVKSEVNNDNSDNGCNDPNVDIGNEVNDNLNYVTIKKDSKILSGRFINRVISDDRIGFMQTEIVSQDETSIIVGINLNCQNCIIDPDFSVLISPEFKETCDTSSGTPNYIIIVSVVAPVLGISLIAAFSYLIYKKRSESKLPMRLKKLNN